MTNPMSPLKVKCKCDYDVSAKAMYPKNELRPEKGIMDIEEIYTEPHKYSTKEKICLFIVSVIVVSLAIEVIMSL